MRKLQLFTFLMLTLGSVLSMSMEVYVLPFPNPQTGVLEGKAAAFITYNMLMYDSRVRAVKFDYNYSGAIANTLTVVPLSADDLVSSFQFTPSYLRGHAFEGKVGPYKDVTKLDLSVNPERLTEEVTKAMARSVNKNIFVVKDINDKIYIIDLDGSMISSLCSFKTYEMLEGKIPKNALDNCDPSMTLILK